jgi:large subunit ribosomal protein L25
MEKFELEASKRSVKGKKNRQLRIEGKVPGVVYGRGVKSEPIELAAKLLERAYRYAGGNKIVALKVGEGRARNVLIHEVQQGSARGELTHVDFYVVRMDEVLRTEIPLHFVGESTAVYQDEGTLVKHMETVAVESLPGDLPDSLEVDISGLDDFEKTMTLADLKLPAGVKLVEEDLETVIAKVDPPRSDEEMAELDEDVNESAELPEGVQEEEPVVVSEENEGDKDRRDKK